jgi:hypothetical protein
LSRLSFAASEADLIEELTRIKEGMETLHQQVLKNLLYAL